MSDAVQKSKNSLERQNEFLEVPGNPHSNPILTKSEPGDNSILIAFGGIVLRRRAIENKKTSPTCRVEALAKTEGDSIIFHFDILFLI